MIKISIFYPAGPQTRFDHDYYESVHIPMAIKLLGAAVKSVSVERGVSPGAPWPEPTYVAVAHFVVESKAAYEAALFPHLAQLQGDLVNYSSVPAMIQFSDITVEHTVQPA
jgi:uncharacterized protein (TIGR02118 family)